MSAKTKTYELAIRQLLLTGRIVERNGKYYLVPSN